MPTPLTSLETPAATRTPLSANRKPRILVVDDQPINVKLLQRKLERQGMEVVVAFNGKECLDSVADQTPDLILLDVMMPEMDGIETCEQLKASPESAAIPIIFITAKASKEGKVEGLDAGAVDYITKPIDLDETLARVRTQLRLQDMHRENLMLQQRLGEARRAAAVGAITKGLAHNLNNLLGVIVGYLDLIKNGYDSPDLVKRSVSLMDNATTRMVEIISQLGSIASRDNVQLLMSPINRLITSSIQRFKDDNDISPEIEVIAEVEDDETIMANEEIFENILVSLLNNAWESYPKSVDTADRYIGISVKVSKDENSPMLFVDVMDAGPGISQEVAATLFEPFTTTKTSVGRGMGLTIARHTMRNLGGEVTVKPREEGGVVARLTHPL